MCHQTGLDCNYLDPAAFSHAVSLVGCHLTFHVLVGLFVSVRNMQKLFITLSNQSVLFSK